MRTEINYICKHCRHCMIIQCDVANQIGHQLTKNRMECLLSRADQDEVEFCRWVTICSSYEPRDSEAARRIMPRICQGCGELHLDCVNHVFSDHFPKPRFAVMCPDCIKARTP